jgi:hypothetical protein
MVDFVKKGGCQILYHTLVSNKYNFNSLHGKNLIIILPRIKCLLEGVSFILDVRDFELHKRATSPSHYSTTHIPCSIPQITKPQLYQKIQFLISTPRFQ